MERCSQTTYPKLHSWRDFTGRSKAKVFLERSTGNKQRLISLTTEIKQALMDFNVAQSSTSVSDNNVGYTKSITKLQDVLSQHRIPVQEINDIIEESFKEKISLMQGCNSNAHVLLDDINDKFEINVREITEDEDMRGLNENAIRKMEQRIAVLETHTNAILKNITILKHMEGKENQINENCIQENALGKMKTLDNEKLLDGTDTNNKMPYNIYDDIFYTTREYNTNLLTYTKSSETMELSRKPKWNPYVKPVYVVTPLQEKLKKYSMFLETND